jgi:hypothetical protein
LMSAAVEGRLPGPLSMDAHHFAAFKAIGRVTLYVLFAVIYPAISLLIWSGLGARLFGSDLDALERLALQLDVVQIHPWLMWRGPLDPFRLFMFSKFTGFIGDMATLATLIYLIGVIADDPHSLVRSTHGWRGLPVTIVNKIFAWAGFLCTLLMVYLVTARSHTAYFDQLATLLVFACVIAAWPSTVIWTAAILIPTLICDVRLKFQRK